MTSRAHRRQSRNQRFGGVRLAEKSTVEWDSGLEGRLLAAFSFASLQKRHVYAMLMTPVWRRQGEAYTE
jgi:hypothetical protein